MGTFEIEINVFLHYDITTRLYGLGSGCGGLNKNGPNRLIYWMFGFQSVDKEV